MGEFNLGSLAKGAATGLGRGTPIGANLRRQRERQSRLQRDEEREMERNLREGVNESLAAMRERFTKIMQAHVQGGGSPDDQKARRIRQEFKSSVERLVGDENIRDAMPYLDPQQEKQWFDFRAQTMPTRAAKREEAQKDVAAEVRTRMEVKEEFKEPTETDVSAMLVMEDGSRINPEAVRRDGKYLVLNDKGNYRPVDEVYEGVQRIVEMPELTGGSGSGDGGIDPDVTADELIGNVGDAERIPWEKGVGPWDATIRGLSNTPLIGRIGRSFFGEEWGKKQNVAKQMGTILESYAKSAFKPGDSKTSNYDLQSVEQAVPNFGAFGSDEATRQQLENLHNEVMRELRQQLEYQKNPQKYGESIVEDSEERMGPLLNLARLTKKMIQITDKPEAEAAFAVEGQDLDAMSADAIADKMMNLKSEEAARELASRLSGRKRTQVQAIINREMQE